MSNGCGAQSVETSFRLAERPQRTRKLDTSSVYGVSGAEKERNTLSSQNFQNSLGFGTAREKR